MDKDKEAKVRGLAGELGRIAADLVNEAGPEFALGLLQYAKDKVSQEISTKFLDSILPDPKDN